jgi:hypothetical protein
MTSKTPRARHAIGEPGIRGEPALVKDPDQAFEFHRVKCEAALEYVNLRRVILHRNRRLFGPWVSLCKLFGVKLCAIFGVPFEYGPTGGAHGRYARKLALDRFRLLQPHLEDDRLLKAVAAATGIPFWALRNLSMTLRPSPEQFRWDLQRYGKWRMQTVTRHQPKEGCFARRRSRGAPLWRLH